MFNDGPYRTVTVKNNYKGEDDVRTVTKKDLIGNKNVINKGGAGKGKQVEEDIDVKDAEFTIKKRVDGTFYTEAATQIINSNDGPKDIRRDENLEELESSNSLLYRPGEKELIDRVFIKFDSSVYENNGNNNGSTSEGSGGVDGPTQGSSMTEVDAGPPVIGGDDNDYTENSKIKDKQLRTITSNFNEVSGENKYQQKFIIVPDSPYVAMKEAECTINVPVEKDKDVVEIRSYEGNLTIYPSSGYNLMDKCVVNVPVSRIKNVQMGFNDLHMQPISGYGDGGHMGYVSIEENDGTPMLRSSAQIVMYPENNYQLNINSNGDHSIQVPQGKDFISGGTVTVNVPNAANVADSLTYQVTGNFDHEENGNSSIVVSSHNLVLSNAPGGSNYDGMKRAIVNVKMNKVEIQEIFFRNTEYNYNIEPDDFVSSINIKVENKVKYLQMWSGTDLREINARLLSENREFSIQNGQFLILIFEKRIDDVSFWKILCCSNFYYMEKTINVNVNEYNTVVYQYLENASPLEFLKIYRARGNDLCMYFDESNIETENNTCKILETGWINNNKILLDFGVTI